MIVPTVWDWRDGTTHAAERSRSCVLESHINFHPLRICFILNIPIQKETQITTHTRYTQGTLLVSHFVGCNRAWKLSKKGLSSVGAATSARSH